jgi:DNA (cytosine-5)-methyltransferase 1
MGFGKWGNSVPPFLAKAVAAEMIKLLEVSLNKPQDKIKLGDEQLLSFNMSQAAQYYNVDPRLIQPRTRKKIVSLIFS